MKHDPGWYIRKIREGDTEAEEAFRKGYLYPFSEIIRHYTFAVSHIPDLMGFTKMVMDDFIRHIKCGDPVNERIPQKGMERFVRDRTGEFIGNEQIRPLFRAIHNQDDGAEDRLRRMFMYTIFLYFDKRLYNPDKFDCVSLANRIMDEWIRIAKKRDDGGDGIRNFVAFLTNNMNKRIMDELIRQYRIKERCQKRRSPIDEWLPKPRCTHKTEILKGLIERILMSGVEHQEEVRHDGEKPPSFSPGYKREEVENAQA